jgi:WD40 repeat protein
MSALPEKTHVAKEFSYKSPLVACRFDSRGRYVYASAEDDTVQRWDLATGKQAVYAGHESWVFALATHPTADVLITGGGGGRLIWWPAAADKPAPLRSVPAHRGWVRSIALSADGSVVATCGNDSAVRLWNFADGTPLFELPDHDRPVYRVLFTSKGRTLLSADLRGLVIEWDYRPGKEARRLDASKLHTYNAAGQGVDYGGVRDLTLSHDGKYLACGGLVDASNPLGAVSNPAVVLFDWQNGKELRVLRARENVLGQITGLRFHSTGFLIAAVGGNAGGYLFFWKPEQAGEFFKLGLPNTARDMDLHPDGARIATAHHDGRVRMSTMAAKTG